VYGITPDKHRAYALQWFTLALVLLLIYISVNTRRLPRQPGQDKR
jgi:cytochrome oxidase assembly protein ShyY1